jgi:hypothetical protein
MIRPSCASVLTFLAALQGAAHAQDPALTKFMIREAEKIARDHHLLSADELKCSTIIYRGLSLGAQRVSFLERHGNGCPGDADIQPLAQPRRFDIEMDFRGGNARWDGGSPDKSMQPLPPLLPGKTPYADQR